jgi:hypothetical protein
MKNENALRAERNRRLGLSASTKPLSSKPAAPAKKPVVAGKAPVAAPKAPAAPVVASTPAVKEMLTAEVVNPATLSKTSSFELSLYNQGTENPHWIVVANGMPVAQIQYADQDAAQLPKDLFEGDNYASSVVQALAQEDPSKILASLRARTFVASVERSKAFEQVKSEVLASADSQFRVARAELRSNILNAVGLVLKAHTKNFLPANDLKAEMFDQLTGIGLPERTATALIESSWDKASTPFFEALFKQAEEWMDLPPEAYKAIEKNIDAMPSRQVEPVQASMSDIPSAAHNVHIDTRVAGVAAPQAGVNYDALFRV